MKSPIAEISDFDLPAQVGRRGSGPKSARSSTSEGHVGTTRELRWQSVNRAPRVANSTSFDASGQTAPDEASSPGSYARAVRSARGPRERNAAAHLPAETLPRVPQGRLRIGGCGVDPWTRDSRSSPTGPQQGPRRVADGHSCGGPSPTIGRSRPRSNRSVAESLPRPPAAAHFAAPHAAPDPAHLRFFFGTKSPIPWLIILSGQGARTRS